MVSLVPAPARSGPVLAVYREVAIDMPLQNRLGVEPLAAVVQYTFERSMTAVGDNVALQPRARPRRFVEDLAVHPQAGVGLLLDL